MSSSVVFDIRRNAKNAVGQEKSQMLHKALSIAEECYSQDPNDEWNEKALMYTLIDLCKLSLESNNLPQAQQYFTKLNSLEMNFFDEIIESQKEYLKKKVDKNYTTIERINQLSKSGNHDTALQQFESLSKSGDLSDIHHESYGWAIYRKVKTDIKTLPVNEVKKYLVIYLNLKNDKPSLLHSTILKMGMWYARNHDEFDFYQFLKLWNPSQFRPEDFHKEYNGEKEYPALFSSVSRLLVEKGYDIDFNELIYKISIDGGMATRRYETIILDGFREAYFWKIFNLQKEKMWVELWKEFDHYIERFGNQGPTEWHTKILSLSERYMSDDNEWRFLDYFEKWDNKIGSWAWEEEKVGEQVYKPIGIKCLKKAYNVSKDPKYKNKDLQWLIDCYAISFKKKLPDEWTRREKALLHIHQKQFEEAQEIFKKLILELSDKAYIWSEFSAAIQNNNKVAMGMLYKAISIEKSEDFLGDIRLSLAQFLINENCGKQAQEQLEIYKQHREKKAWKLPNNFASISSAAAKSQENNFSVEESILLAEEFAFHEIDWVKLILVDTWKNDNGREKLVFTDGGIIDFSVSKRRFSALKNSKIGNVYEFKLKDNRAEIINNRQPSYTLRNARKKEIAYVCTPLVVKSSNEAPWSILDETVVLVDYVNKERKVLHLLMKDGTEIFEKVQKIDVKKGDFLKGYFLQRKFTDKEGKAQTRKSLKNLRKLNINEGIQSFESELAIVDHVNDDKKLFHIVIDRYSDGIIRYNETDLRPSEGDAVEIKCIIKHDVEKNKKYLKLLEIKLTDKEPEHLVKYLTGYVKVNFKRRDNDIETEGYADGSHKLPDFGFIEDTYIPGNILKNAGIAETVKAKAKAVLSRGKWQVIEIESLFDEDESN